MKLDLNTNALRCPIEIPDDVHGLLGIRMWSYEAKMHALHSTGMQYIWAGQIEIQPAPLSHQNGLYCFKLGHANLIGFTTYDVLGLVEMRGEVIEHSDHICRAEWMRILCLFMNQGHFKKEMSLSYFWEKQAPEAKRAQEALEKRYNCKVYLCADRSSWREEISDALNDALQKTSLMKYVGTCSDIISTQGVVSGSLSGHHFSPNSWGGISPMPARVPWSTSRPTTVRVMSHKTPVVDEIKTGEIPMMSDALVHYTIVDTKKLLGDICEKMKDFNTKYYQKPSSVCISMEEMMALSYVYPMDCQSNKAFFMGIPVVASPSLKDDEILIL